MKKRIQVLNGRIIATGVVLLLVFLPFSLIAQQTPQEWLVTIDRSLNPPQYESYRKLINIEPDGSKKEFVLFSLKQDREKVVALFLSPASEKGRFWAWADAETAMLTANSNFPKLETDISNLPYQILDIRSQMSDV